MTLKLHKRHQPRVELQGAVDTVRTHTNSTPRTGDSLITDAVPQVTSKRRFVRLAEIDRVHAESRVAFCHARQNDDRAINRLVNLGHLQSVITSLPLAIADVLTMWLVFLVATNVVELFATWQLETAVAQSWRLAALLVLPLCLSAGHYPGFGLSPMVEFRQIIRCALISVAAYLGIGLFCMPQHWDYYLWTASLSAAMAIVCVPTARFITRALASRSRHWGAPTLIHASPSMAIELYQRLIRTQDGGLRPMGVLLTPDDYAISRLELVEAGVPVYNVREALRTASQTKSTWVLISSDLVMDDNEPLEPSLLSMPHRVTFSPDRVELGLWDRVCTVGSSCGIHGSGVRPSHFKLWIKRAIDFSVTSVTLVLGMPVLAALCAAIKLSSPGPIFYSQKRVGQNGVEFKAWKFRTMVQNADKVLDAYLDSHPACRREWEETHKLKNDPRITSIGRILRKTSLDELPQLWNVLRGEMALIGPRPIVDSTTYDRSYITDYPDEFEVYKSVRPGLSGLWQVSARNNGVYEMRIFWDVYYVRNWSLWMDAYIILRTIRTLVLREGAY